MQLGAAKGARKQANLLDAMAGEMVVEDVRQPLLAAEAPAPTSAAVPAPVSTQPKEVNPFPPVTREACVVSLLFPHSRCYLTVKMFSVHLSVKEKISLELSRDGGVNSLEVKGELDLRISDPSSSKVFLSVGHSDAFGAELQFKTHPNVDKKPWAESKRIGLRDPKKGFPTGQGLGVLKWRLASKDETVVPLSGKEMGTLFFRHHRL
jgi:hypothetical protein